MDSLAILGLVAMVCAVVAGRRRLAWILLGGVGLVKLPLLVVAPWLAAALGWRSLRSAGWLIGVVAIGHLPFVASVPERLEALRVFSAEWAFNPGVWALLEALTTHLGAPSRTLADLLSAALVATVLLGSLWRLRPLRKLHADRSWPRATSGGEAAPAGAPVPSRAVGRGGAVAATHLQVETLAWILGAAAVLTATVNPWYLLWALPFAALARWGSWLLLTGLSLASYLFYADQVERGYVLLLEHGIFWLALVLELGWRRRQRLVDPDSGPGPALEPP